MKKYELKKEFYYKGRITQCFSDGKITFFIDKELGFPVKIPTICEAINADIPEWQKPESIFDCNLLKNS